MNARYPASANSRAALSSTVTPQPCSSPEDGETLEGQAALLKLLADACVAAGALGAFKESEALRNALKTVMPQYDGHLAHYVMALIDQKAFSLAETVLDEAPPSGPYRELVECARAVFLLVSERPGWQEIFERLRDHASDATVRQMARDWLHRVFAESRPLSA